MSNRINDGTSPQRDVRQRAALLSEQENAPNRAATELVTGVTAQKAWSGMSDAAKNVLSVMLKFTPKARSAAGGAHEVLKGNIEAMKRSYAAPLTPKARAVAEMAMRQARIDVLALPEGDERSQLWANLTAIEQKMKR